ncbi:NAD(+) synthase [Dermatobacter hominis]|uniref:NAD(+) synthase n=1 Tax=Dermatobacter hominis TaxID=2884263 RepID=UPI001D12054E|nr:NAD(+) synthase [Dermatobacter hominis]UDY37475.1 NAD(+) synthase [Dermatobacter hominis]
MVADPGADRSFWSPYRHGFARLAAAVPALAVTDVDANVAGTIDLLRAAHERDVAAVVFPELGLTGYSSQDLFHQQALVEAAMTGLDRVRAATEGLVPLTVVGLPLRLGHQLFNVAVALHDGDVLGVVPKAYLPNYREFYEKRHFSAARDAPTGSIEVLGREVPFGAGLLFAARDLPDLVVGVEICEDLWAPLPPSTLMAMAGATVLLNPSGSNITIGKDAYRRSLCSTHSAQTISAYVYSAAGSGESTTDLAWDGHALICENGGILAESERHATEPQLVVRDVDLDRLVADRIRTTSFTDAASDHRAQLAPRRVPFTLGLPDRASPLERAVPRFPFVPTDGPDRDDRCAEVYAIQTSGLVTRLRATGIEKVVVGVSGGLDSTQALLVAARSMDLLGLPRTNVLGVTMPGFATSDRTLADALALMDALGVHADTIDIRPAAQQMLEDLGHPAATGAPDYDVTYENVQAGARTSLLFRLANRHGALVVGTGDLSELALGWCTYGVGDQMSHYGVNASVPKTLVKDLVRWVARSDAFEPATAEVLESILATGISPELVPGSPGDDPDAGPHQRSEDVVGPYDLQDFHLYHVLRFGYRPSKVAFLAHHAWGDRTRGDWPSSVAEEDRHEYDVATLLRWQRKFLVRFFGTSQFKRSAMPDGPKVGSGGSLSPRGDWRAPSDGSAAVWLAELDHVAAELDLA